MGVHVHLIRHYMNVEFNLLLKLHALISVKDRVNLLACSVLGNEVHHFVLV